MRIAVVGATGMIGRMMLTILEERQIPYSELYLYASSRSAGSVIRVNNKPYTVLELHEDHVTNFPVDVALYSAGSTTSLATASLFTSNGAIVIDNSSAYRMIENVPLVVPEINADKIIIQPGILANPNCSTIQSVLPLSVVQRLSEIVRVDYTTYQAVSGSGVKGVEDLIRTSKGESPQFYPYPIHSNVIPHIDRFESDGFTYEEEKMMMETRKILALPHLESSATCVRVPVENAHSVSMIIETKTPVDLEELRELLINTKGIELVDDVSQNRYPTPIDANGIDSVLVGRIRRDRYDVNKVHLFCSADNIKKGAALNAVQILEHIIERSDDNV